MFTCKSEVVRTVVQLWSAGWARTSSRVRVIRLLSPSVRSITAAATAAAAGSRASLASTCCYWRHNPPQRARPRDTALDRMHHVRSGVATGWTGVDMSTPLLLDVAPKIDTNPRSFYRGREVGPVAPPPDPRYRLVLAMSVHPTYFDLATPLVPQWPLCLYLYLTPLRPPSFSSRRVYIVTVVLLVGPSLADGCPYSKYTHITDGCGVGHSHLETWQMLCFRCLQTTTADTFIAYITHDDRTNISSASSRLGAKRRGRL